MGERLGISGSKAERAAAVVTTIDTLEEEGKQREATQLRATLNTKSVQRAYSEAQEKGFIAPAARARPVLPSDAPITLEQWTALDAAGQAEVTARRTARASRPRSWASHASARRGRRTSGTVTGRRGAHRTYSRVVCPSGAAGIGGRVVVRRISLSKGCIFTSGGDEAPPR